MDSVKDLLSLFRQVSLSPQNQMESYLSAGRKVVACAPVYTPEELIHAMGLVPMGAWGADREVSEAKRYFPAFICSIMQTILENGLTGTYQGISAIVIPSLCDSLKCLGQNWIYAVPSVPFIPMIYPQNRNSEHGRAFTQAALESLIAELQKAAGAEYSAEALARSNRIYNRHNQAMRKLGEILIDYPSISAAARNDIFKSAWFMTKEEHTELVNRLIELLQRMPKENKSQKKVIVTGIIADNPDLLAIFAENDLQVAGDDIAHESRQYRVDVDETLAPLAGLADKFARMDHCSVLYDAAKKRGDYIVNLANKTGAAGIVVVLTKFCDPEEFDYPIMKKKFDAAGIPSIVIETDRQMSNYQQARTAMETFRDMLV